MLQCCPVQAVLVAERGVQGPLTDPQVPGQVAHRGGLVAAPPEQLHRAAHRRLRVELPGPCHDPTVTYLDRTLKKSLCLWPPGHSLAIRWPAGRPRLRVVGIRGSGRGARRVQVTPAAAEPDAEQVAAQDAGIPVLAGRGRRPDRSSAVLSVGRVSGVPGRSGATLRRPLAARDASAARTLPTISSLPVRTGWTSRPEADQAARKVAVVPHGHDVSVLRSAGSRASCVQHQGARPGTAPTDLVHRRPGRLARRQCRPRRPRPHPTDISAWLRILVGTCQASASITWLISEPAALRRLLQAERWGSGGGGVRAGHRNRFPAGRGRSESSGGPKDSGAGLGSRHGQVQQLGIGRCSAGPVSGRAGGRVGLLGGNGVHHQVALVAATFGVVRWCAGDQGQDRPSVAPEHLLGEVIPVDHLARLHLVLDGGASWRATVTASPLRTL